jgi:mRNA-degrading endonuclease RelE of RelBE toxin-antitoxin system
MTWTVETTAKVDKQVQKLPNKIKDILLLLVREIEQEGPVRGNWSNYSSLGKGVYHCHLKKGKPTYVAVWTVIDKKIKLMEVKYVGTHEKAPY